MSMKEGIRQKISFFSQRKKKENRNRRNSTGNYVNREKILSEFESPVFLGVGSVISIIRNFPERKPGQTDTGKKWKNQGVLKDLQRLPERLHNAGKFCRIFPKTSESFHSCFDKKKRALSPIINALTKVRNSGGRFLCRGRFI